MTTVDRMMDASEATLDPTDYGGDRIEFLDVDVEYVDVEPEEKSSGYLSGTPHHKTKFNTIRVIRIWDDGEVLETIGLTYDDQKD